ncbi:ThiF family adenylyltransferase [Burkholderia cenocepacia]|uniref:ThiF family adenylyltransferase n=1 Tax=Burkholderia cenocepacia TaxID=95486 RepID=UPI000F5A26E3|nr:ThiF family adenylyltransferase [Burkholderia cenocepacia]RQU50040.1 molybdopterin biosynthesis protein MoeB [Burkholderia cenocepacia]RQV33878.1 molybdopterin biosynthesis protein MoeB [Burkholderia cenocepacia]
MTSKQFDEYLSKARQTAQEISIEKAWSLYIDSIDAVHFFDVREESEIEDGIIPGAHTSGRGFLEIQVTERIPALDTPIVVYCASGTRSIIAAASLQALGYTNAMSLMGGFSAWKTCGYDIERPNTLKSDERRRYGRQLMLPQVGLHGQLKLRQAKVLVVGTGGLGSPCLLYLAAAGVGQIGIVDHDSVDLSNLQRQVLFETDDVGKSKAIVAANRLARMNPDVTLQPLVERLETSNARHICAEYDILIDCTDNFTARYLINDTAVALELPVVQGAVFQFEGYVATLNYRNSPCYRCAYPEPPPADIAPTCSEAGVIGVIPGIIGTLQAAMAIKIILGIKTSTPQPALVYHGLDDRFSERQWRKCPTCECSSPRQSASL